MRLVSLCLGLTMWAHCLFAQNTVGLISHLPDLVYPGFNLVYPHNQSSVFLIDNCGQVLHTWADDSTWRPGNAAYLLENGNLIKTKRGPSPLNDSIWAGGGGETVEIRSWDNDLLATFTLNNDSARLHHDVAVMPDGNILMIAWELKSEAEALQAGRNPELLAQGKLWPDYLLEWDPIQDSVVWEWHAWDHLIQDVDPTKDNFGVVEDHPNRIDINFDTHEGHPDWMHANAIDFNPTLNHIVLSVPYFHEVWVIDHGISREEARGEKGDLLYRWGNPIAYRAGDRLDQQLFFQHDIHWIEPDASRGDSLFGYMAVFNNRVGENYSTGNILATLDSETEEYIQEGLRFGPENFSRTILHPVDSTLLHSTSLSSTQILPNGNALLFAGRWGQAVEITPDNELVWEYLVPLQFGNPVRQGTELTINNNITFRMERYGLDYPAFEEKELTPQGYWELEPNEDFCLQTVSVENQLTEEEEIILYPNPATDKVVLQNSQKGFHTYILKDVLGRKWREISTTSQKVSMDLEGLSPGLYWIEIEGYRALPFLIQ